MPCIPFGDGKGVSGIICTGRQRRVRCKSPGCNEWSVALCDWKLHQVVDGKRQYTGKTCDAPMCAIHRNNVGKDKDLCGPHYAVAQRGGYVK